MKKKISICVPTYNEEGNVYNMYKSLSAIMADMTDYDYEILFEDNKSADRTPEILREIAGNDKKVKVILNMTNVGHVRSGRNCMFRATGDAVINIVCDFQEPVELIPQFISEWEKGNLIVMGQKTSSEESSIKYHFRSLYYRIIQNFSDSKQLTHVTSFGLFDRSIVDVIRMVNEPNMSVRHIVAELGYDVKLIQYKQKERASGKSSYNLLRYADFAINSLVNTSFLPLRLATILGSIAAVISFLIGVVYLVLKLIYWDIFIAGTAPILIALSFLGSVLLLYIGVLGEYIGVILRKVSKRPLVIEKEVLNFDSGNIKQEKELTEQND
ncbi:MAG: glycosyltransferase family 2 protein [Clostridiales bacterium]|nr:glycosyltransferase family 2 protein [Clostridiales bacterium]